MPIHVYVFLLVVWRRCGVMTGSIFSLAPHEEGPSVARSTVC
jgi:hypothetical protein